MTRSRPYEWWSRNLWALRGLYSLVFLGRGSTFRRHSIAALDLDTGDRVLELGCGPGNSFESLRTAVGEDGTVVGVDYSRGMVERGADRTAEAGWENVHVIQGDAAMPGVGAATFDAVYAAMSLSAMPDPTTVVETAPAYLAPEGRLAVLDARPFQRMPLSLLNPLVAPVFERTTDWNPGVDIPAAVESTFESTSVRGYHQGSIYIASGTRPRVTRHPATVE